jgi:ribosomal protein S21
MQYKAEVEKSNKMKCMKKREAVKKVSEQRARQNKALEQN